MHYRFRNSMDYGPQMHVADVSRLARENNNFRVAIWTGEYAQMTIMSIDVGDEIGTEIHPELDQMIRVEAGQGMAVMGCDKNSMNYRRCLACGDVVFVPAGTWHNVINTGNTSLKLSSIYSPPNHPRGTVEMCKTD